MAAAAENTQGEAGAIMSENRTYFKLRGVAESEAAQETVTDVTSGRHRQSTS